MAKTLKKGEIYNYPKGTRVRIKDSVLCSKKFHRGGELVFQKACKADKDEYRVGIRVEKGICFCFHPDDYELIEE